jgi:hypothetical protein
MSDASPAPRTSRLRRTAFLAVAVAVVAILVPIVTIVTVGSPEFLIMGARLALPWSGSNAGMTDAAIAPTVVGAPVSPEAAGEALRRILRDQSTGPNITMRLADPVALPDRDSVPAGVFTDARHSERGGLDWAKTLVVARRRLSPAEREYLAGIAANPFWQQWDILARAPSLDILGARVELPFREHATAVELPLMRLTRLNDAGQLTAARAAHFLSIGRRDSAEAAVHATLAVGLLIDREATNVLEAFIGRRLIYVATTLSNGLRGDTTSVEIPRLPRDSTIHSVSESRALLVNVASDSTAHRGVRVEALMNLAMLPCTNTRELLFGFRSDVKGAFASARRNLVRHPSDSALLDLLEFASERSPDMHEEGIFPAMFRGMSHFSSAVLFNKRIHGCAEMLPYLRMM